MNAAAIRTKLLANGAVSALVGAKIYPVIAKPLPVPPYVIFQGAGSDPSPTHGEANGASNRLVQFSCWAADYTTAQTLRDAVVVALDNQPLSTGERPILEDDTRDDYDAAVDLYRCDADFLI